MHSNQNQMDEGRTFYLTFLLRFSRRFFADKICFSIFFVRLCLPKQFIYICFDICQPIHWSCGGIVLVESHSPTVVVNCAPRVRLGNAFPLFWTFQSGSKPKKYVLSGYRKVQPAISFSNVKQFLSVSWSIYSWNKSMNYKIDLRHFDWLGFCSFWFTSYAHDSFSIGIARMNRLESSSLLDIIIFLLWRQARFHYGGAGSTRIFDHHNWPIEIKFS